MPNQFAGSFEQNIRVVEFRASIEAEVDVVLARARIWMAKFCVQAGISSPAGLHLTDGMAFVVGR